MRKLIVASTLALAFALTPACKKPDPNQWETHVEAIKDPDKRAEGFRGMERLVKAVATAKDNKEQFDKFGSVAVPALDTIWDEADEHHEAILQILLDMGHPEAATIWNKAIDLDGSDDARKKTVKAIEGIRKAKATGSVERLVEELDKLIADPKNDMGDKVQGDIRRLIALTLGMLGDAKAVPVLIKAMEQPIEKQPVKVHRAAAESLGRIADPSAVDALVTVTYRVPDLATSTNIGEKAKQSLAAIGDPAVPKVLDMLRGDNSVVQKAAAEHGLEQYNIQMTAASFLGVIGRPSAVDELIAFMPKEVCVAQPVEEEPKKKKKKKEGEEEEEPALDPNAGLVRAVIANSLGLIGDEKAVDTLCQCAKSSKNPGDMFPIAEALGRIGGTKATDCLVDVIKTAEYDQEAVANSDFVHQIRWEAARFGILGASADDIGKVKEAIASNTEAKVVEEMAQWQAGVAAVEECKKDKACWQGKLADTSADWIVREKAAVELARMSPGDTAVAAEIAKAYKVRSPDARVTMVWLIAHMLGDGETKCKACVDEIERIMKSEKDSRLDAKYQLSVLTARYTTAKLRESDAAADDGSE